MIWKASQKTRQGEMETEWTTGVLKKDIYINVYIYINKYGSKFSKISEIIAFKLEFSQLQATEFIACSMKSNDVMKRNLRSLPPSPRQTDSPRDQCPLLTCWLHAQQGRAWTSLVLFKFGLIGSPTGWEDNLACSSSHIFIAPLSLEQRLWLGGSGHLSSEMLRDYLSMS